jgi:hypothetical protein
MPDRSPHTHHRHCQQRQHQFARHQLHRRRRPLATHASASMGAHGENPSPGALRRPLPASAGRGDFRCASRARQNRRTRGGVRESTTTDCVACQANHARLGPVLVAKIIRFAVTPNHPYNSRHPAPMRGAYRDRHGRWVRDAMDAAASGATESQGGLRLVSDGPPRRRPALKRLRRNFGRQHMSRSKRFGGGSRVRQRRVVLAPVAGVKLMEICRAQPGLDKSPIRQRRRPKEFGSGESAL